MRTKFLTDLQYKTIYFLWDHGGYTVEELSEVMKIGRRRVKEVIEIYVSQKMKTARELIAQGYSNEKIVEGLHLKSITAVQAKRELLQSEGIEG